MQILIPPTGNTIIENKKELLLELERHHADFVEMQKSLNTIQITENNQIDATKTLMKSFEDKIDQTTLAITTQIDRLRNLNSEIKDKNIENLQQIQAGIQEQKTLLENMMNNNNILNSTLSNLSQKIGNENEIPEKIDEVGNSISNKLDESITDLNNKLERSLSDLQEVVNKIEPKISKGIEGNLENIKDSTEEIVKEYTNSTKLVLNTLNESIKNLSDSFKSGLSTIKAAGKLSSEEAELMKKLEKFIK